MDLFQVNATDNFKAFGREGEYWRKRFDVMIEREAQLIEEYGMEPLIYLAQYIKDRLPHFPMMDKYLNDSYIDDEILVILIPLFEDAFDNFEAEEAI